MSSKTISLKLTAYEKLNAAKRPGESFSQVVLRARWPEDTLTAGALLAAWRTRGWRLDEEVLTRVEELKSHDQPPEDKWRER